MDVQCEQLCKAMNMLKGIRTIESCCGHSKDTYRIWFKADSLEVLPKLLYWFSACHCGFYGWRVEVKTDCAMSPVSFCVVASGSLSVYDEAGIIAKLIIDDQSGPASEGDK